MHYLIEAIGISVIAATILGLVCHRLQQPLILGYLLAGAIIGPQIGLSLVSDVHTIEIVSELGLVLLLFIIGLEINLQEIIRSGRQLLITSFGQFPLGVVLGLISFSLLAIFSYDPAYSLTPLYLSVLCALSSTAIVVKALYDKGELDTLPGRITLGTLVAQDLFAILFLAVQPHLTSPHFLPIAQALLNTCLLLGIGYLVSKYLLSRVFASIAKSPEMVVSVSLAWCAAAAATGDFLGLSREMGALVAGLSISAFPYSVHVTAKTTPLRDFFLTLFFVSVGMKIPQPTVGVIAPAFLICAFIVLSRFLSVYPLVAMSGAGRRAAFVSSLNLCQLSEFSLVIGSLGIQYNQVSAELVSALIFAMVALSVVSSYLIRFNHELFVVWNKILHPFFPERSEGIDDTARVSRSIEIVFLGFHRGARALLSAIEERSPELLPKILVIDFNPVTLDELKAKGVSVMFGDIASLDTLKHARIDRARVVLSTIPDMLLRGIDNRTLARMVRSVAPRVWMVATADDAHHERRLRKEGVDLAVRPFDLMGEWLASFVKKTLVAEEEATEAIEQMSATGRWLVPAIEHITGSSSLGGKSPENNSSLGEKIEKISAG